ncbi:putative peptidoglycan lipid II flippase [Anoxybacillus vitaminiphilus]|uniref:Putative peptidoglycan lipid II flippase n=1 Tax=Paranoxybacillus vitaminiphilus TaxID=581036 RepID=A0A327YHT8_9BACL|nr:murein biosynthesis integral membrane protein MurJ [Anoxybacillus vitaminiphilus]RAK19907.1 putative peptidoglycan lipid II flippase [Anoxybacillus vitaminiphilus]
MSKKRIVQIISVVAIINILSRLLGFFREVVIGYHFGTSSLADSVILAYTIPNFLYLVLGGAVTTAYISIYNKIANDFSKRQFQQLIFTYLLIVTSLLTVSFMMFSEQAVSFFFNTLSSSELKTTSELFFIMAVSIIPLIFSMWFSGILNVQNKFYGPSLAILANNAGFILIAVILYPLLGVYAYGWGAVIGAAIMLLILIAYLKKGEAVDFQLRLMMSEKEYIIRMLKVTFPILLGGATLQFYFLIHRVFASELEDGYVAALNYASKLVQLPQTVLMTAVTTVIYPLLAKKAAEQDYKEISRIFYKGLQSLMILIIPISIFVYFYADGIVKIIFEYGAFTAQSTEMTANMLKILVIGMFAHAANLFVSRFFYAMEKSAMPVITGFLAVFVVNVLIIMLFIKEYGAAAIAWATTISSLFQFFVLLIAGKFQLRLEAVNNKITFKLLSYILLLIPIAYILRLTVYFNYDVVHVMISFVLFFAAALFLLKVFGLLDKSVLTKKSHS